RGVITDAIFKLYSLGVVTSRDEWAYDFNESELAEKMKLLIQNYNSEVFRVSQSVMLLSTYTDEFENFINNFVNNDPHFLKWTDRLKEALAKKQILKYDERKIRRSLYRPFSKRFLYFDHLLNQRRYQQHLIFPTS